MNDSLTILAAIARGVRVLALAALAVTAAVMAADWAVRTRRVNPFGTLARFTRRRVDPRLRPLEARLVRAGANPANAPLFLLLGVAAGALLLIFLTDTLAGMAVQATHAGAVGGRAPLIVGASWIFAFLRLALLVRVVSSWIQLGRYSPWVRWSYRVTDWMLHPLQRIVPNVGIVDITPLIAYFGLVIIERVLVGLLAG